MTDTCDGRLNENDFLAQRTKVLETWSTGPAVADWDAAVEYQRAIPAAMRFGTAMKEADAAGITLIQPRAGVCLVDEHIALLRQLQDLGGADLLPTTIDSYTRQNRYTEAQHGVEESLKSGRSMLNGFPAVNHGVEACRRVVESVRRPIQVRHGTPDARLLAEITLAAGFTAFEGGGISYNLPYTKNVPLEQSIADWQYVDRLVGRYADRGIIINREPFGPLTGTMVPPCLAIAVAILEALLAAEQGVRDITVGYGQCGNLAQDIAALRVLRKLARQWLDHFGHADVTLTTVFHQWMGGFPQDEAQAFGVICWGAVAAAMAGATKVITKSPHEALGVPTAEANAQGLRATRQVLNMVRGQARLETPQIASEMEITQREASQLMEAALHLGDQHIARAAVRGFQAGILDIPFAPSRSAQGAVIPVRDLEGAVRILEFGKLPFTPDLKAFHHDRLQARAKAERRTVSFQMVSDDIYAISKGRLVGSPR